MYVYVYILILIIMFTNICIEVHVCTYYIYTCMYMYIPTYHLCIHVLIHMYLLLRCDAHL